MTTADGPIPAPARSAVRRGVGLGLRTVAAALSLLVLVGSGWAWATFRNFNDNVTRLNVVSHSKAAARNIDGTDQNILIVGNDDRDTATDAELATLGTQRDGGSYNTDTMMLLHLPADGRKATAISFPRDSYVQIADGGPMAKLNSAFSWGMGQHNGDKSAGASVLEDTIENLTGLSVDHFVQVDLLGFYRISQAIGGVTVCLNNAMGPSTHYGDKRDGLDAGFEPDGSYIYSYSHIDLHKGNNSISGTQALAFVRQRHGLPRGDLDRIVRQQTFLALAFRQVTSGKTLLNPFALQKLLTAVRLSVKTDRTLNLTTLAGQLQNLSAGNVNFLTIPQAGDATIDGVGQVQRIDSAAMADFIDRVIGRPGAAQLKKVTAANPRTVTVAVLNDADASGLETTNAAALARLGFRTTVPPATSDVIAKTTIRYPKGAEAAAKAVLAAVPGAVLVASADVRTVTLVIGNNGVQAAPLMPKHPVTSSTSTAPPTPAPNYQAVNAASAGCIN